MIKDTTYSNRNPVLNGKSLNDLPKFDLNRFPRRISFNPENVIKYPRGDKSGLTEEDLTLKNFSQPFLKFYAESYIDSAYIQIQIAKRYLVIDNIKKLINELASNFIFGKEKFFKYYFDTYNEVLDGYKK